MDTTWTVGVLSAASENVQTLASGMTSTRAGAVEAASDALVMAAMDRGRQEYRIWVADTQIVLLPGLTEQDEVDLIDLAGALLAVESFHSNES